jgi:plasmid stabilization system protein ParE
MDCAVIYSRAALADLQEITELIAKDNAEVATRFANQISPRDYQVAQQGGGDCLDA